MASFETARGVFWVKEERDRIGKEIRKITKGARKVQERGIQMEASIAVWTYNSTSPDAIRWRRHRNNLTDRSIVHIIPCSNLFVTC
jgi:hypothetical protein